MNTNHDSERGMQISRREAMRRGLEGAAGAMLASGLGAAALGDALPTSKPTVKAKAKSVIQIFLWGGMSHNDTWDPKPESGSEFMGDFSKVISTNVPGIQLGALFPELAKQADKFS
ncbi:MAG: DUF1501 domain-containing protein, partial [Thermoguttaceae bacterium]